MSPGDTFTETVARERDRIGYVSQLYPRRKECNAKSGTNAGCCFCASRSSAGRVSASSGLYGRHHGWPLSWRWRWELDDPGISGSPGSPGSPGSGSSPGTGGNSAPGVGGRPPAPANSAPGVSQLRRLTVLEYRNTVRDLLGVTDAQMLDLAGDQQAMTSGYTTGAAITTATDARKLLEGADRLVQAAMPNLAAQVPCIKDAAAAEPCARQFIVQFGRRAFRRPLVDEEITRWLGLYNAQRDPAVGATFSEAIRGVTIALLQSPNFLYRRELAPGAAIKDGNFVRFNSYEMASRLSYSFWASMPDERLFELADGRQAADGPGHPGRRPVACWFIPKAKDVYADFAAQWLNLAPVVSAQKATALNFTPEVGKAMLAETGAFFADLFMAPGATGRMDQLFTSNKTFVDETLARHLRGPGRHGQRAVSRDPGPEAAGGLVHPADLPDHARRFGGILPHPARCRGRAAGPVPRDRGPRRTW